MDNTEQLTISFCTGYGGIERGLEAAGVKIRTVAYVEIEAYAIANMVNKMETEQMVPAPVWTNLKTFPVEKFRGLVDGITGGYPCQPFSCAGKRLGEEDSRHLWPYIYNAVRVIQPRWVFFENVEGHLTQGIVQVLADLEGLGYKVEAGIFSAAEVGAPHQRKRVFILGKLGNSSDLRLRRLSENAGEITTDENGEKRRMYEPSGTSPLSGNESQPEELADSNQQRLQRSRAKRQSSRRSEAVRHTRQSGTTLWPARPGEPQYDWEEPRVMEAAERIGRRRGNQDIGEHTGRSAAEDKAEGSCGAHCGHYKQSKAQSGLGGTINGPSSRLDAVVNRVDRLRLLGNGVLPATAKKAWRTLNGKFKMEV